MILLAWIVLAVVLIMVVPVGNPAANERASFLPENTEYCQAVELLSDDFPSQYGLSKAVILVERPGKPFTKADQIYINGLPQSIRNQWPRDLWPHDPQKLMMTSPGSIDAPFSFVQGWDNGVDRLKKMAGMFFSRESTSDADHGKSMFRNPLRSEPGKTGQAALVMINIPSNFITYRSSKVVEEIRKMLLEFPRPEGLKVAVTGTGGYGYDYACFVEKSYDSTFKATLIAVVVILLIVYRSPIAAMVPLLGISLAAVIVVKLMGLAQAQGFNIGMAEKIFVFVLMYGAGIDYSLLLISRYRELLGHCATRADAAGMALNMTFPAILASATTDSAGILMLIFAQFLIFQTTGPVVAGALVVAALAALTLVPALVGICAPVLFWPANSRPHPMAVVKHPIWRRVADLVVRRPLPVLIITLLLVAIPMTQAFNIPWVYDALAAIEPTFYDAEGKDVDEPAQGLGNATAGAEIAKAHWPIGEISPTILLLKSEAPLGSQQWETLSKKLTAGIGKMPGVHNVRSMTQPLGGGLAKPQGTLFTRAMARVGNRYLSPSQNGRHRSMRLEAVVEMNPMSNPAMKLSDEIRDQADTIVKQAGLKGVTVQMAGATAQMMAIRDVTQRDFKVVAALVLGIIFLIVLLLLRDVIMTAFMVAAIGISYLTTLGICVWTFPYLFPSGGLDWKLQIFLFVVIAAVGVDYNIFLAARLVQEGFRHPPREAVIRAVVYTGPVISSCGLIMAATLGALMAGQIELLRQLGFALGLGMIIDTFITRPLLLPAFASLLGRTGKGGWLLRITTKHQ